MCIFVSPVRNVSKTKILVSTATLDKQIYGLIVYQNTVTFAGEKGTMVLPVPNRKRRGIRVVGLETPKERGMKPDQKACVKLFDHLEEMTKPAEPFGATSFESFGVRDKAAPLSLSPLTVHSAGSWVYSFAPDMESLKRFQKDKLNLLGDRAEEGLEVLAKHYPRGFGFVAMRLTSGATMVPFAYLCELQENGTVFVPTRHFHPSLPPKAADTATTAFDPFMHSTGQSNWSGNAEPYNENQSYEFPTLVLSSSPQSSESKDELDWDHTIYTVDGKIQLLDSEPPSTSKPAIGTVAVRAVETLLGLGFPGLARSTLHRMVIGKSYTFNHDLHMVPTPDKRYCDVCHTTIADRTRWTCPLCPNFDACNACGEGSIPHPDDHPLVQRPMICSLTLLPDKVAWHKYNSPKDLPIYKENPEVAAFVFHVGDQAYEKSLWKILLEDEGVPSAFTTWKPKALGLFKPTENANAVFLTLAMLRHLGKT